MILYILQKLIIGKTKSWIHGKELSVNGHTHKVTDLSGILQLAHGGTGVSNLNALKQLLGITSGGTFITTGQYTGTGSNNFAIIRSQKPIKLCMIPYVLCDGRYEFRYVFLTDIIIRDMNEQHSHDMIYHHSYYSGGAKDGLYLIQQVICNDDITEIQIKSESLNSLNDIYHYILFT